MKTDQAEYFYNRTFVIAAMGLGLGIATAWFFIGPVAYWTAGIALMTALALHILKTPRLPLLLLAFAMGLIRLQLAYPVLPKPVDSCELTGRIVQIPIRQTASWRIILDDAEKNGFPIDGRVLLTLRDRHERYSPQYGQTLRVSASISLAKGVRNEGGLDMRMYCFTQGISCTALSKNGVAVLQDGKTDLFGSLLALREQTTIRLTAMLQEENGSLAAGILHGDIKDIPDTILTDFRDSGISHLLSVSGLHVSLLAGAVLYLLRRCREGTQLAIIAALVLLYSAFTAFSAPAVRAGIMVICLQLSNVFWRRNDPLSSLSLAFILILAVSPFSLFSAGFQLSFSAMLGIFLLYPVLTSAFSSLPQPISDSIALSLSASAATLPATAAHFNRMPLLAVFSNLLVTPLAALSLLPSGIALLLFPLSPALANLIAQITGITLSLIRAVARAASMPGVITIVTPTTGAAAMYFAAMLFVSPFCRAQKKEKTLLTAICVFLSMLLWIYPSFSRPSSYVTVLDVPRGYAAHIHSIQGDTLTGTLNALNSSDMQEYLAANNIGKYDIISGDPGGTTVSLGDTALFILPGAVQTETSLYETAQNGQMRFFIQQGELRVKAYADDARYAILMEKSAMP